MTATFASLLPRLDPAYVPHTPSPTQAAALIAWQMLPDPLGDPVEIGYGGSAGGGKSDLVLMAALEYVHVPGYAALVLRRTFKELSLPGALLARSRSWLANSDARWTDEFPPKTWTFPSGATLTFGYLATDGDCDQYQSSEFQFCAFDEATHFTKYQYTYLFSRLRRLEGFPVPLRLYSATNPGGAGHSWYKARFVEPVEPKDELEAAEAARRVFIPARLSDNPHIDQKAYTASLNHLPPAVRDQLLRGDWGAFEGAAFPDFSDQLHVVAPFEFPPYWQRFEMMDHGFNNPTAWYLGLVDVDGNVLVGDGYYAPGLVSKHGPEIRQRRENGWWARDDHGNLEPVTCWADPSVKNRYGNTDRITGKELSVELEYADMGIQLAPAQNDRRAGYLRVAEMLRPDPGRLFPEWHPRAGELGSPRLFVMRVSGTAELRKQLEEAPVKAEGKDMLEIVDPDWEGMHGHGTAALRYGLMSRPMASVRPIQPVEDKRELVQRVMRGESPESLGWDVERLGWEPETEEVFS